MRISQWPRIFTYSAGTLLLASSVGLFLSLWAGAGLIHPCEPLTGLNWAEFLRLLGGLELAVAMVCLFGKQVNWQTGLVLWLALIFAAYLSGLWWIGCHGGLTGYMLDFATALAISAKTTQCLFDDLFVYLLTGSLLAAVAVWRQPPSFNPPVTPRDTPLVECGDNLVSHKPSAATWVRTLKISCGTCGGHIEFPTRLFGAEVACPHCQARITLAKPAPLKMTCPGCSVHLEFPSHARGQNVLCPQCQLAVTLNITA